MKKQIYLSGLFSILMMLGWIRVHAQCTIIPVGITVATTSCSTASATWTPVSGAFGYEYVVTTSTPGSSGTPVSSSTASFTGLTPSTIYFLQVRTECTAGSYSPWSSPITFMTPACSCATPSGFTAGPISCDSTAFVWGGASDVEYVIDNIPSDPTGAGTHASGTGIVVGGLSPLTVYYVHLRADCGGSFSAWETRIITMPACPCAAPTGFSLGPVGCDSVMFVWPFPGGYANWQYVVDMSPAPPSGAGTPASGSIGGVGGLLPMTVYYVHLRTDCGGGTYSSWMTLAVTTPPCSACMPPAPAAVTPGLTTAVLSWSAATGVTGYEYVVNTTAGDPSGAGIATPLTSVSVTGLVPGTGYYVHTRSACTSGGFSDWSAGQAFATPPATGVSNLQSQQAAVTAYPDPAKDVITIVTGIAPAAGAYLTFHSADGRVVKHIAISSSKTQIDISDLASGIYIVTYTNEGDSQKLLISKE